MRHRFLEASYRQLEWQRWRPGDASVLQSTYSVSSTVQNALCYMFNSVVAVFYLKKPRLRELK